MKDALIEIVDEVVIAGGSPRRHRSRAGLQLLQSGELFVAFRVGLDMFDIPHGGVVGTWSRDGGKPGMSSCLWWPSQDGIGSAPSGCYDSPTVRC